MCDLIDMEYKTLNRGRLKYVCYSWASVENTEILGKADQVSVQWLGVEKSKSKLNFNKILK